MKGRLAHRPFINTHPSFVSFSEALSGMQATDTEPLR